MPIPISSMPQDSLSAKRQLDDNLRGKGLVEVSGLRDSKGFGVRLGVRASSSRGLGSTLGTSLGFGGETSKGSSARNFRLAGEFSPDASSRPMSFRPDSMRKSFSLQKSFFARMPQEPEDARLTGITRSLARRLLALNLPGSLRTRPVMRVEGIRLADKFA
jgi:hypothetical protein